MLVLSLELRLMRRCHNLSAASDLNNKLFSSRFNGELTEIQEEQRLHEMREEVDEHW